MNNLSYLFTAYTIIWIALFIFLLRIASRLKKMEREVESLQERKK